LPWCVKPVEWLAFFVCCPSLTHQILVVCPQITLIKVYKMLGSYRANNDRLVVVVLLLLCASLSAPFQAGDRGKLLAETCF